MPLNVEEIMHVLSTLSDHNGLRVTVKESLKCGLMVGAAATIGALAFGPVGVAVCGTVGSLAAAKNMSGFKSVARVILEDMTPQQQLQLANSCRMIINDLRVEDAAMLIPILINTPHLQQQLINNVVNYVTNDMRLTIVD